MNGLCSRTPSPRAVRPLLAVALLATVGAALMLFHPTLPASLRLGAAGLVIMAMVAIVAGIGGERATAASREARR